MELTHRRRPAAANEPATVQEKQFAPTVRKKPAKEPSSEAFAGVELRRARAFKLFSGAGCAQRDWCSFVQLKTHAQSNFSARFTLGESRGFRIGDARSFFFDVGVKI